MARKWTFLIKVFLEATDGDVVEIGAFEPAGISPWKIAGSMGPASEQMDSEKYAYFSNAMAMADFIRSIGDKNTLSFKKLRCPISQDILDAKNAGESLFAIKFCVTPLSSISRGLRGEARLNAIYKNCLSYVTLKTVTVSYFWTVNYTGDQVARKWDFATFEAREVGKFQFREKDW